jgi:predicted metal-dependent phosphotriesterase family hydrolase
LTDRQIQTVTGPISPEAVGPASMHEHLIMDLRHSYRGFVASLSDVDLAIEEIGHLKAAGGSTVVELTSKGLGRDVVALRRVSEATGVNIITGTGYYMESYYPREVYEQSTFELAQTLIEELTVQIGATGIRAGIIGEIGTGRGTISPAEERVFRAAARAHKATGVPISTHTSWGGELALDQVRLLADEGVNPSSIIVGHLGDTRQIEPLVELGRLGAYLEIDHIGWREFERDDIRVLIIRELIEKGFGKQILLSSEVAFKTQLHAFGGHGYDHLLRIFVPALEAAGVDSAALEDLLINNPRRALTPIR